MEHIVSMSGGKDSTAMLIEMLERNMQVDRIIFADPLYEFPELYEYLEKVNKYIKRYGDYEIEIIKTDMNLRDEIFRPISRGPRKGEITGWPLVAFGCYWSRDAKQGLLNKEMEGSIRYIGIAIDEKERMAKNWEELGYRYPLIEWGWTEQDCLDYLKEKDLHNPLYDKFDRLGCWWCPKQSIKSLRILYNDYPELWEKMLKLDREIKEVNPDRQFKPNVSLEQLDKKFKEEIWVKENQLKMF